MNELGNIKVPDGYYDVRYSGKYTDQGIIDLKNNN